MDAYHYARMLRALLTAAGLVLAVSGSLRAEMTMPAAPPELSEQLKSYRTPQQRQSSASAAQAPPAMRQDGHFAPGGSQVQRVHADAAFEELLGSAPRDDRAVAVPGDLGAGVQRYRFAYTPHASIMLPFAGSAVVRFYDLNGQPWNISTFDFDHQGCSAQLSATPWELIIRPGAGASSTTLHVLLEELPEDFELSVRTIHLKNSRGQPITTAIHGIEIEHYRSLGEYVRPSVHHEQSPARPAAADGPSGISLDELREALVESLEHLQ